MNNQEEVPTVRNIFIAVMLVTIFSGYDIAHTPAPEVQAQDSVTAVSTSTPTAKPTTVTQEYDLNTVDGYIKYKFGKDYSKAMLLLQGQGARTCAENRSLDQNAKNHNWIKDKPGEFWSTDWGVFQINDKFHPVETLNLRTDYKANIDYAYRMFEKDGNTFSKRWTCGKFWKSMGYDI